MPESSADRITGASAAAVLADVALPAVAGGVIARRRPVMRLLERIQLDARSVSRIQQLRRRHDGRPVELVFPGRRVLVITSPEDVARVLHEAPSPFDPANREKHAALRQFQPHGVLISGEPVRERRRAWNEAALDTGESLHRLAIPFAKAVDRAATTILDSAADGSLSAAELTTQWWRLVRELVLGPAARDDDTVTDQLWRLRSAANWSYLIPPRRARRDRFFDMLYRYAEQAEETTLIGALAGLPTGPDLDPIGQVPHWLFAFDAAGMALIRALALLSTHPEHNARARADAAEPERPRVRAYLRACMLESLRLWPTTPAILRELTSETQWGTAQNTSFTAPGAAVLIATPAFHRDPDLLPFAHIFDPDIWLDGRAEHYPQLVPFSAGPAACPGRDLVLFATSTLLAHLLDHTDYRLLSRPRPTPDAPLPMTLDNFGIQFAASPVC